MAHVTLKDVTKIYDGDILAVEQANFEIPDECFTVLVGPSGCGKSTMLRMIAGLEEITEAISILMTNASTTYHLKIEISLWSSKTTPSTHT